MSAYGDMARGVACARRKVGRVCANPKCNGPIPTSRSGQATYCSASCQNAARPSRRGQRRQRKARERAWAPDKALVAHHRGLRALIAMPAHKVRCYACLATTVRPWGAPCGVCGQSNPETRVA